MHKQILKIIAVVISIYGLMLFAACTPVVIEAPTPNEPTTNAFPDLRVAITAPASAVAGSDIGPQLTVQVRNDGNGIAFGTQSAGSNGYMVDVVLSRDTSIPEGWATYAASYQEDVLLKGGRISNTTDLSPRQSSRYEVGGGIPADTPPGVYFICAKVDAGNTVGELREDNNAACARIRITAAPTTEVPTRLPTEISPERPRPTPLPTEMPTKEDCISFNPHTARVFSLVSGWHILDGNRVLFDFGQKKTEADQALRIIKHYGMNQSCFVGRPQPSFQYLLVSGNAPVGSMPGEDCVAFNPQTTTVQSINGQWKIVDGNHWLFDFGDNRSEAMMALEIIKRHGFTQSCFVGRPNASFTYLRK
jgi:hypothetical protein